MTAGPETPCDLQHAMNYVSLLALKRGKVIYFSAKSNFFLSKGAALKHAFNYNDEVIKFVDECNYPCSFSVLNVL